MGYVNKSLSLMVNVACTIPYRQSKVTRFKGRSIQGMTVSGNTLARQ